jgi:hypothetical protein
MFSGGKVWRIILSRAEFEREAKSELIILGSASSLLGADCASRIPR